MAGSPLAMRSYSAVRTRAVESGFVEIYCRRNQAICCWQRCRGLLVVFVFVDWQTVCSGLRRSAFGVHLLPPSVGLFLILVFFQL
jgi:hypothetical protein